MASFLGAEDLLAKRKKRKKAKKKKLKKKRKRCLKNADNRWCKKKCRNVATDPGNCGACSNVCDSGENCVGGTCTPGECPGSQTRCSGICVDMDTDPDNCGACDNACGADAICDDGVCQECTVTCDGNGATCGAALQSALDAGGDIYVCPGRYVGEFDIDTANVTVAGAGDGDDPASNTILDANQSGRVVSIATGRVATLRRLRITGGNDAGASAGVRNVGTLTMTSCSVVGNSATGAGGAGGFSQNQNATGPMTLTNCTISGNSGNGNGGGINQASETHAVTLTNCDITDNQAGLDGDGTGGGINVQAGTVNIDGGSITGNTAATDGGGIFNSEFGTVNLDGVSVSGNSPNQCTNVVGC